MLQKCIRVYLSQLEVRDIPNVSLLVDNFHGDIFESIDMISISIRFKHLLYLVAWPALSLLIGRWVQWAVVILSGLDLWWTKLVLHLIERICWNYKSEA